MLSLWNGLTLSFRWAVRQSVVKDEHMKCPIRLQLITIQDEEQVFHEVGFWTKRCSLYVLCETILKGTLEWK